MSVRTPTPEERKILSGIKTALDKDRLVELPPIPHVAADLLGLTAPEEPSFPDIASCIGRDPVIAAKLMGLANSTFFRGRSDVQTVEVAIVRLGTKIIRAFAVGVAASSLAPVPRNWAALRSALWNHCVATGVSTKLIAQRIHKGDADTLFLGGLFHDVGNLVTLQLALEQNPDLAPDFVSSILERFRVKAGVKVLAHWDVPKVYQQLLRQTITTQPTASDSDTTRVIPYASDVSRALGLGPPSAEPVDLLQHPLREQLGLDDEAVQQLSEELPARVQELIPFLSY